jgi:hypothetical protein
MCYFLCTIILLTILVQENKRRDGEPAHQTYNGARIDVGQGREVKWKVGKVRVVPPLTVTHLTDSALRQRYFISKLSSSLIDSEIM